MPSFYEIHDSTLEKISTAEGSLELTLKAIRIDWPTPGFDLDGETFSQRILIRFEDVSVSVDSSSVLEQLLDGSFAAELSDASPADDLKDGYTIPASMRTAENVHTVLAGQDESGHEYITMDIPQNA
ncbi:hypothetical protein DYQ86_07675 [Acidobacteria bacterium AB60]|nr:hypothetical protein DYQ86_07675 [Acidobacteria bacterium AB60]